MFAVSLLASSALIVFVMRHGFRLRKAFLRGEHYALSHPGFDFAVVTIIMVGYILTRSSGFIR